MFKKYFLVFIFLLPLPGCEKISLHIDEVTTVTQKQKNDAHLLYRGLLYGNLDQIKKHTAPEYYKKIQDNPEFLEAVKQLIPKKNDYEKKIIAVRSNTNIPNFWKKTLTVVYSYQYEDEIIIYNVVYDAKTEEIIDVTLSQAIQ